MRQEKKLLDIIDDEEIDLRYLPIKRRNKGFYGDGMIGLSQYIETSSEHVCILAEELGHYYTTTSNIIDQKSLENQKQEKRAHNWAHIRLIPLNKFIECYYHGCHDRFDTAEFLEVTEKFLDEALGYYKEKYGVLTIVDDHVIYFDPLGVMKLL